jgi:hypothetical protein
MHMRAFEIGPALIAFDETRGFLVYSVPMDDHETARRFYPVAEVRVLQLVQVEDRRKFRTSCYDDGYVRRLPCLRAYMRDPLGGGLQCFEGVSPDELG